MDFGLVGIDCATVDEGVGMALGRATAGGAQVDDVFCPGERTAVTIAADWLRQMKGPCLIAIDAPLGWPSTMGPGLTQGARYPEFQERLAGR